MRTKKKRGRKVGSASLENGTRCPRLATVWARCRKCAARIVLASGANAVNMPGKKRLAILNVAGWQHGLCPKCQGVKPGVAFLLVNSRVRYHNSGLESQFEEFVGFMEMNEKRVWERFTRTQEVFDAFTRYRKSNEEHEEPEPEDFSVAPVGKRFARASQQVREPESFDFA